MPDVLVDTSVWIDFFKRRDSIYSETLDGLIEERRVCITDLVRAEILPGARSERELREPADYLGAIPLLPEPEGMWEEIIHTQFRLIRSGLNGMSIPDLMIAVTARAHDKIIFTKDADFKLIGTVLPLRLLGAH